MKSKTLTDDELDTQSRVQFRATSFPHRFKVKPKIPRVVKVDAIGDHYGRQQNHIWTAEERSEKMSMLYHYAEDRDRPCHAQPHVRTLSRMSNYFTGYDPVDLTVTAMEWRLILFESIAGVHGLIAAGCRHFHFYVT